MIFGLYDLRVRVVLLVGMENCGFPWRFNTKCKSQENRGIVVEVSQNGASIRGGRSLSQSQRISASALDVVPKLPA